MSTLLIVFESRFGEAANVADHVGDAARAHGFDPSVLHVAAAANVRITDYDAVVVAAPLHFGSYPPRITRFLRTRRDVLATRPLAFVSVATHARHASKLSRLVAETGAYPDVATTVAGLVAHPECHPLLALARKARSFVKGAPMELADGTALERALQPFFAMTPKRIHDACSPDESGIHRIGGAELSRAHG